jgi:hypothetical protein
MNTFLPYPDFPKCAKVLDWRRLGKQRVESMQVLRTLRVGGGWRWHPAVLMWKNYEEALENYGNAMVEEWIRRGYNNTLSFPFHPEAKMPPWLGDCRLHASHQSNLLRKEPEHYRPLFPGIGNDLPYFWPTKLTHAAIGGTIGP